MSAHSTTIHRLMGRIARIEAEVQRLSRMLPAGSPDPELVARTYALVSQEFGVPEKALRGPGKSRQVTEARHYVAWILKTVGRLSSTSIAYSMGKLDHGTALHSIRRAGALMTAYPREQARVQRLAELLTETKRQSSPTQL